MRSFYIGLGSICKTDLKGKKTIHFPLMIFFGFLLGAGR